MNEYLQARALFRAFLARFFENEISEGSRDLQSSFMRIIGMLAAPGFLLPFSNLWRWTGLAAAGAAVLRRESLADKTLYLSLGMGAMMLLAAVVWQALLPDRRDAIVLGSFPVRARTIVAAKLAALFAYLGIVATGMHVVGALTFGAMLSGDVLGTLRAVPGHFIACVLASMFACLAVAAFQSLTLAIAGPRVFARLTAPAQLLLATTGIGLIMMSPLMGAAAVGLVRGSAQAAWGVWAPPVWFIAIAEVIIGGAAPLMPALAARALLAMGIVIGILVATYPLAYRRVAAAAMQGSPLSRRRSLAGALLQRVMRRMPASAATRGTVHFILLTLGRIARNKLIVASALGGAVAIAIPFIVRWASAASFLDVPGRSYIAVPFLFVMLGLAGMRMAYNVPTEPGASWIFTTAAHPARTGTTAARIVGLFVGGVLPALITLPAYAWVWGPAIGISMALTIVAFGCFISEIGLHTVDFVPFTRAYSPERGNIQARWPAFLVAGVLFLQFLPWVIRTLLSYGNYWLGPALIALLALVLRYNHPPEPRLLVDADHANKPLALRLY
ncbi:MAG: hypothetical protein M3Q55_05145 [Acidobacteriota bacterium]|nr:hypothetical protein [Acidobacteriota bacterium]